MLHPDHDRVQAALRREPAAVEWLVACLTCIPRMVQQIASRGTRLPRSEWPDAAQDAALVVLRRLPSYHGQAPVEAWMHRIGLNAIRARARRRRPMLAGSMETLAGDGADPAERLIAAEHSARLREEVDAVGGVEADVLRQRHFECLEFETIAQRTGIGIGTLRTRYYRGLERLRRRLSAALVAEDHSP